MTPTQQKIFNYLRARKKKWVQGKELAVAIIPGRDPIGIRVQINRMRGAGVPIETNNSHKAGSGYRLCK